VNPNLLTLAESAARSASFTGEWQYVDEVDGALFLLAVTAAATEVGDTLDVYVDTSLDGVTAVNCVHFTQVLGNGGAVKYAAQLDPTNPGTSVFVATSDCAAGAVRPAVIGAYFRVRSVVVDAGTVNASFTWSLLALTR
jgi:hypothetical protein